MRKFLLSTIAMMFSVVMLAAGSGDGKSKANAIDFNWVDGHEHVGTAWYRVDLSQINGMVDPTLALYLTNLTDESVKVNVEEVSATISISVPGFSYSKDTTMSGGEYTIGARDYKLWSQNVKKLLEMNVRYLHLKLNAAQNIMLSAKKYETSDIVDLACEDADDFDWSGVQVAAGEKWYRLNLAEVKAQNKKLNFVVTNQGSQNATVAFDLSLDCPASVVFGYNWTIPAGGSMTEEFGRVFIDELKEDYVYLKLNTNQALNLRVEEEVAPAPKDETWVVDATLVEGQAYTFSGEQVFEVPMATLSAPRGMKAEFVITNNGSADATLTKQIAFANPVKSTIDKELVVAAGETVTKEVVNNMAGVITSEKAYIRFNATQELTIQLNYVVVNEEVMNAKPVEIATCEKSQLLNWNSTITQSGLETKWYEIDLSSIKQNGEHLQLSFTNKTNNLLVIVGEIVPTCGSKDTIPYILPLPAGETVSQLINYNIFALVPHPTHFYMSATVLPTTAKSILDFKNVRSKADLMAFVPKDLDALQAAEVELTARTVSASADPTDCNTALTIERGVKYEQAAGTTKWYRVTDDLLSQLSLIPDVAFINNGKQAANVTIAAGVSCEYSTFGMSTVALPTWADFTFFPARLIGALLDKALNEDVTEMYLQVSTDQPIAFGIDIDYGFGLGCDDAREFDWTNGAVIEKGDAQWLSFDISSVKKNEQQIKLTLTNESNSLAWVAMLTSLTCPFDVAIPMVFPIPAGMSVDKVVDYSYFASTKLDQLYIGLITEETVSVKAQAEKAIASTHDQQACENAVVVKSGELYENKGTQWYKFSGELFSDMSRLPRFRFATPEGKTKVTLGATVGCEYNIATKVTLPVPGNMDLSFRFPSFIFDVIRKLVHQDVTEVYLEMTTDKELEWSIDMTYVDACETAVPLDFSKPIQLDLKANEDVWYTVDVNAIKALKNKDIEYAVYNRSDKQVTIEAEISPTCPVIVTATKSKTLAANDSLVGSVSTNMLLTIHDNLLKDYPTLKGLSENLVYYVRVRANGDLSINTDTITPPTPEDPDACADATLLDWTQTINLSTLTTGWYKFDISALQASKKDFRLSLNNDMNETKAVEMDLYLNCNDPRIANTTQVFPVGVTSRNIAYSLLTSIVGDANEIYVYIQTDVEVPEVKDPDACLNAIELTWNDTLYVNGGDTTWYMLPLAEAKALGKDLKLTVTNLSSEDAIVNVAVAEQCPVVAYVADRDGTIPANMSISKLLTNSELASFADTVYFRLSSTQDLSINAAVDVEEPEKPQGCEDAILLDWTKTINLSDLKTGWYKVDISSIQGTNKDLTLSLNNDLEEKKNLGFRLYKHCDSPMLGETVLTFPVGITSRTIPASLLGLVDGIDMLYIYLTIDAPLPCEGAILFDWNKGAYQDANKTQWYEFDITPVLDEEKQVKLTFTNHSDENAWVIAELAMNCPYTKSIPIIVPVPAGMSIDKWIDYSAFEASRVEHFYLGVTTREAAIELAATWEDARIAPSDGCLNATLVQNDSLYEHAAGTHWYKFTGDLFDKEGYFSRVRVVNRSAETVNITAGGTVGCEYNIATRTRFKLPKRYDLAFALPVWVIEQMKKFVDDDVKEFYLELTTDQPIAFSFGQEACETAIPFDWTTGHTQEALTTQWYEVDIAPVLANEQQIKLTLTNHSNQTAWVASLVSLDCPFLVALPLAFPIPAGMSVDKVIDYSYFAATRLDHIYVGVSTDSKISVIAEAQSAEASATDKQGCADATLLQNGEKYTHPAGTSWYKVDGSLFADMSSFPTFRFATVSGEKTKVTVGATVGCDYNIATKGTVNVPGGIDLSLRMPSFIFKVLKHFVREDVNEFYVQITTDKSVDFAIDTTTTEDVTACMDAIDLVVTDSMTIDLAGNTEQWYKVDLSALKGTNKDLAVKVVNPSNQPVDVEVEVSTDCPVMASVIKEATAPASLNITKVITAEQIAKLFEKYPDLIYYARVRTSGDLHAEISEYIPPVDGCAEAIEYVWGTDLEINANEEGWYKLAIVDLRNQDCDIKLTVTNNAADSVTADVAIYETCPIDIPLVSMDDLAIAPTTTRVEEVSSDYLPDDVDTVYLHIKPTGDLIVNVSTNCIPDPVVEFAYDTITALVCDSSEYISSVSHETHLISSADASSLTWNDIVHVHATLDSVYTFLITPIVAPQAMSDALLETIYGTMPLLTPGKLAAVDVNPIMDYYNTNDTEAIANVITVEWKASTVDCNATTHAMTLVVIDDCGNEITTTHTFPVDVHPRGEVEYVTICDGEVHRWNGQPYDTTGVYSITIQDINGCDSVATLNLTVLPATQYITEKKVVCYGETYLWNGQVCDQSREYSHTIKNALACDSIIYTLQFTVLPQTVEIEENMTICSGDYVTWHGNHYDATGTYTYEAINEYNCVDTIYTLNLKVLPTAKDSIDRHFICEGESLTWKDGNTYSTDIVGPTYSESYTHSTCDSITYHLDLKVVSNEPIYDGFCYGDTYSFTLDNGVVKSYDSTGVYVEQLGNCDLILYLTEYDPIPVTYVDTTVCYGAAFKWNGMDINATLSGDTTFVSRSGVHGCDSTIVLRWNVLQPAITVGKDTTICYGESFMWNGYTCNITTTYTYVESNYLGCDSIINVLNVTVLPNKVIDEESLTICATEVPYAWYGQSLTATQTYYATEQFANQLCDSVEHILHLTVMPAKVTDEESATICASELPYLWQGLKLDATGTYNIVEKFVNADCDSVEHILHLTVNQPVETHETVVACGSYEWNGVTYYKSGDYQVDNVAANGCDSTAYLHLTVYDQQEKEYTASICSGTTYTWPVNNDTYDKAGVYEYVEYHVGTTCPSVVHVLNLEVLNDGEQKEEYRTICEGDTLPWNGQILTTSGDYVHTLPGCNASIILHLTVKPIARGEETITACDSYLWNGTKYTESGDYPFTTKGNGETCDSIATLHLTINKSVRTEVDTVACDSLEWNGQMYKKSGYYTQSFTTINGCDSIVVMHMTINNSIKYEITETACDKFTWDGTTYTTSGDYTKNYTTVAGCDSIVTLHLTINESYNVKDTIVVCEAYDWNNTTYTESGDYVGTFTSATGCDSIVNLHLIVLPAPVKANIEEQTICTGDSVQWRGKYYSQPGFYYDTVLNIAGCADTIYSLRIAEHDKINPYVIDQGVCHGGSYLWDLTGETYDQPGFYSTTLPSVNGCDSVVTLHLIVHDEVKPTIQTSTICYGDTLYWNSKAYTTTTKDTIVLVDKFGCDSIICLDLTVLPEIPVQIESATVNYGEPYYWNKNGQTYYGTIKDTAVFTTANGCDSIWELQLTELPPVLQYEYKTIEDFVCDGTGYEDYITKEQHIISSLVTSTQTWQDTVNVSPELDSIYVFKITPIVAPAKMTDATLATIFGAMPILTPGMMPNVDTAAIKNYYDINDNDTISDVTKVTWIAASVPCGATTHTMTLVVEDACDNILKTEHIFPVAAVEEAQPQEVTICHGETYQWAVNNQIYSETNVYKDTLQSTITGCDSIIVTLNLTVRPEIITMVDTTVCRPYNARPGQPIYVWREASKTYTESAKDTVVFGGASVTGCDSTVILNLTINEPVMSDTTITVCYGDTYDWNGLLCDKEGDHIVVLTSSTGCDSVATLHLKYHPKTDDTEETVYVCAGGTYEWHGTTYTEGDYTITLQDPNGCPYNATLHLKSHPKTDDTEETVYVCAGESYEWNGTTYTEGDYTITLQDSNGCPYNATLHLKSHPKTDDTEETVYVCAGESYEWNGTTYTEGDYTITLQDENGCPYTATLHLTILDELTLPNVTADDVVAICGKAIDVTIADAIIQSHIAAYDWVENVVWEVLVDGKWSPLTDEAIYGDKEIVSVRYTISTSCGNLTDTFDVVVQTPNPENTEEYANIPAYNKYGGRLLTLDLQYIVNTFGWNIAEEQVTWYLVVEGGEDIPQGTGYYLTTEDGAPLPAGSYYALIERPATSERDCDVVLQTIILVVEAQVGPSLAPTVAKPNELIRLLNLDPNAVSTVQMYSANGELLDTFQVTDKKEVVFHAAHVVGYYIVEVQTEAGKVSLRYIVK